MEYLSLAKFTEHEVVIQKSRFIGLTYLISSEEELLLCLEDARKRYPNATHYCYGAVIGLDGLLQRFSDDGEPGGTAGMPILQVLLQKGLRNVLVVVVRYFGGIKLGAGGLVRAYSRTAAEVVNKSGIVKMVLSSQAVLSINYNLLGSVEHFLHQPGIAIRGISYCEKVNIHILTNHDWNSLKSRLIDLCSGNIEIKRLDNVYHNWD